MGYEATRRVEASARTFAIVERLDRGGRARISTIASDLEMSKGIVHNHVSTLRELGYVVKTGDHYQLSAAFVALGHRVRTESPLYRAASGVLETYADGDDRGVVLLQRAGDEAVVVDEHRLSPALGLSVGSTHPLARSLPGVLLGVHDETDGEPERITATVEEYDPERLRSELADRGVVVGPLTPTGRTLCVAFPVVGDDGDQRGSVGVTVPDDSAAPREGAIEPFVRLRSRIENRIGSDDTDERSFATEKHSWIDG